MHLAEVAQPYISILSVLFYLATVTSPLYVPYVRSSVSSNYDILHVLYILCLTYIRTYVYS